MTPSTLSRRPASEDQRQAAHGCLLGLSGNMDFVADLARLAGADLAQSGVAFHKKLLEDKPLAFYARYLEFRARRIAQKRRRVLFSDILSAGEKRARYGPAIDALAHASEHGEDLSRFQTKDIDHFTKPDLLFSDWSIHHLHLGAPQAAGRPSKRTNELLFVLVKETPEICFIDIRDHRSFAEVELLETVERNWPHLLDRFHIRNAKNLQPEPTAKDRELLRKAGIVTFVELASGRILAPPGGGVTTARSSVNCMLRAQATARRLVQAERVVQAKSKRIRASLKMAPHEEIHLMVYRGTYVVVGPSDGRNGVQIPILD